MCKKLQEWEGRKVPTKSLFEQEAPKIGAQKCSTKRSVRGSLHVEFALNSRRFCQGRSVREKSVRGNDPIKMKKMNGAFSLNNLFLGPEKVFPRICLPKILANFG